MGQETHLPTLPYAIDEVCLKWKSTCAALKEKVTYLKELNSK